MPGAGDGDTRRIGVDFDNLVAVGKVARHPRMNFDFAGHARIEGKMQLAGNDLHDADVARMAHLLRCEVEGAFPRFDVGQIDFRVDFVGLQLADDAFRAAYADLRFLDRLGTDLQLRGNMLKDNGCVQRDFRRLLVSRNQKPQPGGQNQRKHLQS